MSMDAELRWVSDEPDRVRALLAALGFGKGNSGSMAVPGLIVVVERAGGADRLHSLAGDNHPVASEVRTGSAARLLAVGVATVDLDRVAATSDDPLRTLPDDDLLGARVAGVGDARVVLLEPAAEGRLAATLARHGEGPAALYVAVQPAHRAALRVRLLDLGERPRHGRGPFGQQLLASTRHPWGPHLLVVTRARRPVEPDPRTARGLPSDP
jgi:hypothetical protein